MVLYSSAIGLSVNGISGHKKTQPGGVAPDWAYGLE